MNRLKLLETVSVDFGIAAMSASPKTLILDRGTMVRVLRRC